MTAEEESAFASAQAATGTAMLAPAPASASAPDYLATLDGGSGGTADTDPAEVPDPDAAPDADPGPDAAPDAAPPLPLASACGTCRREIELGTVAGDGL